ncbi:MAG: hypothetical protein AAGG44_07855 [Planctomycetota bacterium]
MSTTVEIRQFHEQLRLLASAGIKLDLEGNGKGYSSEQLASVLQRLEYQSGSSQSSASPSAGTDGEPGMALPQYDIALHSWLRSGGVPESLSILVDSEVGAGRIRTFRHLRLVHPFAWTLIIGVSLLILARFYAPKAVSLANNMGVSATWVDLLATLRDFQILWLIAIPVVLLLIFVIIWRRSSSHQLLSSEYGRALLRSAKIRQWMQLQSIIPKPREAWHIASGQSASGLRETNLQVDSAVEPKPSNAQITDKGTANAEHSPPPPLVRWALGAVESHTDASAEPRPTYAKRLELVRDAYKTIEASHRIPLRNVMPRGLVVVMGGLAIASLGIAMFYPIVQMLLFVSGELGQTP